MLILNKHVLILTSVTQLHAWDSWHTKGAFFWDYSRMRIHGREARCVLLSDIPIPEWTEYYSGHSAPEGGMNRIILKMVYSKEGNKSKKCYFHKIHESTMLFWLFSLPLISSHTNSSHKWNHFEFLILLLDNIPSNPLFSFWNSPTKMHPKFDFICKHA